MMFIRESRWSKVIAAGNAIGLTLVGLLACGYLFGIYPTSIAYRVVPNGAISSEALTHRVRSRIGELAPNVQLQYDEETSRLTIRDWKYNSRTIEDALAIEGTIQLAWLAASDTQLNGDFTPLPLAGKFSIDSLANDMKGLSATVTTGKRPLDLTAAMISGVDTKKSLNHSISIELSAIGREQLATLRAGEPKGALGLIIGGLVEGIAMSDAISNKRIKFELCDQSEFSPARIKAALCGPDLPCELELIE